MNLSIGNILLGFGVFISIIFLLDDLQSGKSIIISLISLCIYLFLLIVLNFIAYKIRKEE